MYVNVNFQRRPGVPGPPLLRVLVIFFFFFFNLTNRPTQCQETHPTLNEKKGGDGLIKIVQNLIEDWLWVEMQRVLSN